MKFNKTDKVYRQINDFIRGEMKRQKISQNDLAYRLCLPQTSISQRLCGKTVWTLKEVIEVYDILNVEKDWMI